MKQNKKKVPEVACKDFPFTEEGLALALGDLVNSCQLHQLCPDISAAVSPAPEPVCARLM